MFYKGYREFMNDYGTKKYQDILFILTEKDPYKILGISDDVDFETINRAYREYAKKYHPDLFINENDRQGLKELEFIFAKITAAFNKLKDPESRKRFDYEKNLRQTKTEAENNPETGINIKTTTPGTYNFSDIDDSKKNINLDISISGTDRNLNKKNSLDIKKRKSEEADLLFRQGFAYFNHNNLEEAISRIQAAIKINPKVAHYHSYLALAMKRKGWDGYAQAEFKVALHYDPSDKIALENYNNLVNPEKNHENQSEKKPGFFKKLFKKK
jgi:DnaJ-class molecular chaperone